MEFLKPSNFNFQAFYVNFKQVCFQHQAPSEEWLTWFIGFSEGDGSFIVTNRKDCMFVITQSFDDIKSLQTIEQTLGFGKIYAQSKNQKTARYIVQDQTNVGPQLLCLS